MPERPGCEVWSVRVRRRTVAVGEVMRVAESFSSPEWLSVEVFDGRFSAARWREAHGDALTEAALSNAARYWEWHTTRWGVVLELAFADDAALDRFRNLAAVRAALDAVPDPVTGLLVYRGRGGGAGSSVPRRPRPRPAAGAAALPAPHDTPRAPLPPAGREVLAAAS